ncbi:MAG: quinone oxidoreductase [Alphaproteobacteria bacterium]|nr:quinone oxidoreductase [Alphaproteobacteria bacterium]HCP00251.1 quinone oxidoreductase [Rhodospirillaceae bacterium]
MKTQAFRIYKFGGTGEMKWETVDVPGPGRGEVLLRHTAIGLNLADTYRRTGLYPMPLPNGMGNEAVGVVEAVGPGVRALKVGDRVGYIGDQPFDAYSERRIAKVSGLIPLPKFIDDRTAAAVLLKGITAQYLLRDAYTVKRGDTILVHAAAGGVGIIMCQWANAIGATVIGTVSTQEKARFAKRNGCHHPIVVKRKGPKFSKKVRELTDGKGVQCVYDSVGKETWEESLACAALRGTVINFGSASGNPPLVNLAATGPMGSPFIARCALVNYTITRKETLARADDLFKAIRRGHVKVRVKQRYKLKDAPKAQRDIEGRRTTGSTVLIP